MRSAQSIFDAAVSIKRRRSDSPGGRSTFLSKGQTFLQVPPVNQSEHRAGDHEQERRLKEDCLINMAAELACRKPILGASPIDHAVSLCVITPKQQQQTL